jgi:Uncharacterised protein family (UPF0158)
LVNPAIRALDVDLDELLIAFEAEAGDLHWYLDTHHGAVILVSREYDPAEHDGLTVVDIETDPTRFVRVPPLEAQQAVDDMTFFANSVADPQLKQTLDIALSASRPEKRFRAALSWLPEQQALWHSFRQERCLARVTQWLASLGLRTKD